MLNSSDENYEKQLSELSLKLKATLFLDAVAGEQTSTLVNAAPYGSQIILYANLSNSDIRINPRILIQGNKKIESFYLGGWAKTRSITQTLAAAKKAQKLVATDLQSNIQKRYNLSQIMEAVTFYENNMTGGKILITMEK